MTYKNIREMIFFGLVAIILLIAWKKKIKRKKLFVVSLLVACMVLLSLSEMFPVENLFMQFGTPQEVVEYTTKGNAKKVVYGQDSCMVIYSKGNATNNYYFVPKDGDGYKIPDRFAEKTVYKNLDTTGIIYVYNVRGTKDYYVSVFAYRKGTKLDILDMNGNQIDVEMDELFVDSDTMAGRAYFLAEGYSDGYFITINEERIYIS